MHITHCSCHDMVNSTLNGEITSSFLLLVVRHLLLVAWHLLLVAMHLLLVASQSLNSFLPVAALVGFISPGTGTEVLASCTDQQKQSPPGPLAPTFSYKARKS